MTPAAQPAQLAGIDVAVDRVRFDLLTSDGVTCVAMPLDAASHQALRAVLALYTHSHGCPGHVDVHVGLLLGVVAALHGGPRSWLCAETPTSRSGCGCTTGQ